MPFTHSSVSITPAHSTLLTISRRSKTDLVIYACRLADYELAVCKVGVVKSPVIFLQKIMQEWKNCVK
jgi:hypothetical protein